MVASPRAGVATPDLGVRMTARDLLVPWHDHEGVRVMPAVSLHERMALVLDRTGALDAAMHLRRIAPVRTVSIVTFHRIDEPRQDDPYDPETVDATPAQFRRHVETLARIGAPISMDALLAGLEGAELPAFVRLVEVEPARMAACGSHPRQIHGRCHESVGS